MAVLVIILLLLDIVVDALTGLDHLYTVSEEVLVASEICDCIVDGLSELAKGVSCLVHIVDEFYALREKDIELLELVFFGIGAKLIIIKESF